MECCNLSKPRSCHHGDSHCSPKRSISVMGTGVVVCGPDVFSFSVTIVSSKPVLSDARTSVKRRGDYILQVLRNHSVKNVQSVTDSMSEADRDEHTVEMSVSVDCGDIDKCCEVRDLIMNKLDSPSVHCSTIQCSHSPQWIAHKTEEAFTVAVANAKSKARSVCHTLGLSLGPVISLVETQHSEDTEQGPPAEIGSRGDKGNTGYLTTRIKEATLEYSSRVTAVFEASAIRCCSHKKCTKHA